MWFPLSAGAYPATAYGLFERIATPRGWPTFAIDGVTIKGMRVAVREAVEAREAFCRLVHFERDARRNDPRLLIVPPLSGQCPAMLRDMVVALLAGHDVYLADWINACDVPVAAGPFGFDDNIAYVMRFIRRLGPDVHVIGLCQSVVPTLAAASLLAADGDRAQPRSLALFAGPVDCRIHPTRVDRLLKMRPLSWFERTVVATVPPPHVGEGRRVYPGFVQLSGLMMFLARHLAQGGELFDKLTHDDGVDAARHPFIELYMAVMDLPAEFFLENVKRVFHEHRLARGLLLWRGRRVEPSAISRTALMTVEGEDDDVSGAGQTRAAHDLCVAVPADKRAHYVQPGVGHFGTFHGRRWREEILPRLSAFIRASA